MMPSEARWISAVPDKPQSVEIVLFIGCHILGMPFEAFTLIDIFNEINVDFVALGGEGICCGGADYLWGDVERAENSARKMVSKIIAFEPAKVVFECGACYLRCAGPLRKLFPASIGLEPVNEFLLNNLNRIRFLNMVEKKATFHDSCNLGRGAGKYETGRKLVQAIPGVKLIEMRHNREDGFCCGGTSSIAWPEATKKAQLDRLNEAKAVGADLLVTDCLDCAAVLSRRGDIYPFRIMSYIQLLGEAMGITYKNKLNEYLHKYLLDPDIDKLLEQTRETVTANGLSLQEARQVLCSYFHALIRGGFSVETDRMRQ
jgi:Fe-S oxidoreductase